MHDVCTCTMMHSKKVRAGPPTPPFSQMSKSTSAQSDDGHVQVAKPSDYAEMEVKAVDPMEVRRQQRIQQKNYGRIGASRGSLSMEKKPNASAFAPPPVPSDAVSKSRPQKSRGRQGSGPSPSVPPPAPVPQVGAQAQARGRGKSKHIPKGPLSKINFGELMAQKKKLNVAPPENAARKKEETNSSMFAAIKNLRQFHGDDDDDDDADDSGSWSD